MDRFISHDETQKYGPALRENLAAAFAQSPKQVQAFVAYLVKQQASADKAMAEGMKKARAAATDLSKAAGDKGPDAASTRALLSGVYKHLDAKKALGEWQGNPKAIFPKPLSDIGTSMGDLKGALAAAIAGLEKDKKVPDGAKLLARLKAAQKKLAAHATKTGGAAAAARKGLSEQSAEKKDWTACYRGIALIAEGLLTMEKRADQIRSLVPHRSAPGGKKKATAKKKAPVTP